MCSVVHEGKPYAQLVDATALGPIGKLYVIWSKTEALEKPDQFRFHIAASAGDSSKWTKKEYLAKAFIHQEQSPVYDWIRETCDMGATGSNIMTTAEQQLHITYLCDIQLPALKTRPLDALRGPHFDPKRTTPEQKEVFLQMMDHILNDQIRSIYDFYRDSPRILNPKPFRSSQSRLLRMMDLIKQLHGPQNVVDELAVHLQSILS